MRKIPPLIVLVTGLILGQPVMAQEKGGPFGIYMGMPAAELIDLGATVDTGFYSFDHSPKGFGELSSFDVLALEEQGACMIEAAAIGLTDKQGEQRYRSIHDKLSKALGPPQEATDTIEFLQFAKFTVARWLSDTGFGAPMEKAKLVALILYKEMPDDQTGVEATVDLSLKISFTEISLSKQSECFVGYIRGEVSKAFNQLTTDTALFAELIPSRSSEVQEKDGPFGIWMGMTKEELLPEGKTEADRIIRERYLQDHFEFTIDVQPPRPHPSFNRYTVRVTPDHGVCKIEAKTPLNLPVGYSPEAVIKRLGEKYGIPVRSEIPNSIHGDYDFIWVSRNDPRHVSRVDFKTSKLDGRNDYSMEVTIWFDNFENCSEKDLSEKQNPF